MTKAEKVLNDIYIWLMLGVFPLFVLPGGYTNITNTKYLFFACATAAFCIANLILQVVQKRWRFRLSPTHWAVLAFLAAAVLSAVFSDYPVSTLMGMGRSEGLPTLGLYVLVFLCAGSIGYKRSYIVPLCLSSVGFSSVALMQFMDKNPLGLYPAEYYYYAAQDIYTARFVGTLGNEGIACAFMCVALPFMFAYFVTSKTKRSALTLPVMALLFFVLLYTGVLGGILGAAAAIALACVMLFTSSRRLSRILLALSCLTLSAAAKYLIVPHYSYPELNIEIRVNIVFVFILIAAAVPAVCALLFHLCPFRLNVSRTRGVLLLLGATALILALLFVLGSDASEGFVYELREVLSGNINEEFGSSRIKIWSRSLRLFLEQPVLGSGPNTVFERMDITFSRFSPIKGDYVYTSVDNAHNEYLNLLVNLGVLGLVPFVAAQVITLTGKKKPKPCVYGLLGYIVQSMFLFSICITAPYYWLLLGMCSTKSE
ncbi:MAG: O-antigen ligase family protein [Clostridia bacterium]|nr:O-antigen ligase family protein [Clostridia bacterium]